MASGFLALAGGLWRSRGLVAHAATRRFRPQDDPSLEPARSALSYPPNTRRRAGDAAGHPAAALWVARLGDFGGFGCDAIWDTPMRHLRLFSLGFDAPHLRQFNKTNHLRSKK